MSKNYLTKDEWVGLFRKVGMDDEMMHRWHIEFERMSPEAHKDFLQALGIPSAEVQKIRRWCKQEMRRK